jgi:hypothetical protein
VECILSHQITLRCWLHSSTLGQGKMGNASSKKKLSTFFSWIRYQFSYSLLLIFAPTKPWYVIFLQKYKYSLYYKNSAVALLSRFRNSTVNKSRRKKVEEDVLSTARSSGLGRFLATTTRYTVDRTSSRNFVHTRQIFAQRKRRHFFVRIFCGEIN